MMEQDVIQVADFINEALSNHGDAAKLKDIQQRVFAFNKAFPLPR